MVRAYAEHRHANRHGKAEKRHANRHLCVTKMGKASRGGRARVAPTVRRRARLGQGSVPWPLLGCTAPERQGSPPASIAAGDNRRDRDAGEHERAGAGGLGGGSDYGCGVSSRRQSLLRRLLHLASGRTGPSNMGRLVAVVRRCRRLGGGRGGGRLDGVHEPERAQHRGDAALCPGLGCVRPRGLGHRDRS